VSSIDLRAPRLRPAAITVLSVLLAGLAALLLLARPAVSVRPGAPIALLVAIFSAILIASLVAPVPKGAHAVLAPALVLGLGVGAITAATLLVHPVVPLAVGVWTIPLNTLAAVSEEALFRRFLYGRLERFGVPVAIGATAMAFALIHVPMYGPAALPIDLAAGLLLGWQRWASGTWTVPAATHVAANLLAVLR
jgi:membrane protease YdiL (CAAX protease family)